MPEPELIQRQHDLLRHFRQAGHTREDQETEIRKQYEDLVVEVDTTLDKVRLSVETERARILPAAETQRKSEHDKIENAIDIVQSNVSGHLEKIEMTVEMVHSDFMSIEDLQELWPDEGADISVGIIDNAEQQLVQCEQFLAEVADQIRSAVDEYHEDRILSARRQQQKRMIVLLSLVPVVFAVAMQIAGVKGVWRFNSDAIVFSVSMAILVPLLVAIIWWIISMIRDVDEYHEDRILSARRQQQKRMIVLLSLVPVVFAVAMQIAGVRVLWRYNSDAIVVSFSVAILVPLLVATIWWLNSLIRQDNSSSGNRPQASTKPVTTPANIEMSMAETQNIRPMNDSPSSMFVEVPAGTFLMGSSSDEGENNEQPQHSVFLDDFWISLTAVTNAQWRAFMQAGGYDRQELWTDEAWDWCTENDIVEPGCWDDTNLNADNQPVVGVSWHEASAYCRWLSEVSGGEVRLATEAEWEKAAMAYARTPRSSRRSWRWPSRPS